jgi:hypothetical protein
MAVRLTEYRPTIVIDGTQQTKWLWGPRFFPLDPGRHHVEIYVRYFLMKSGRAELDVDLAPGQIRRISYRFPFVIFQRGRITEV